MNDERKIVYCNLRKSIAFTTKFYIFIGHRVRLLYLQAIRFNITTIFTDSLTRKNNNKNEEKWTNHN